MKENLFDRFNRLKKQEGVTLMELLLVLVVIAIIIIMAIRYYSSVRVSQKAEQTFQTIQAVRGALEQGGAATSGFGSGTVLTLSQLSNAGLLPAGTATVSPWTAGDTQWITVAAGSSLTGAPAGARMSITAVLPSNAVCLLILNKVKATSSSPSDPVSSAQTTCAGASLTVFY